MVTLARSLSSSVPVLLLFPCLLGAPAAARGDGGPRLTADEYLQIAAQVSSIGEAKLDVLEELIADTRPDDPELPDLLFRLAEQHAVVQRLAGIRATDLHRRIEVAGGAERERLRRLQRRHFRDAEAARARALSVYGRLAEDPRFRAYPLRDHALFAYGWTLRQAGRTAESHEALRRLLVQHPESRFVADALLAIGEHHFDAGELGRAWSFYDRAIAVGGPRIRAYARFKKAWVAHNRRRHGDALALFHQVGEETRAIEELAALHGAALSGFVRAFAEVGRVTTALAAFRRAAGGDRALAMLAELADLYVHRGDAASAAYALRELIRAQPDSPRVCEWQRRVLDAVQGAGDPARDLAEVERLAAVNLSRARAARAGAFDREAREELRSCAADSAVTLGEIARLWHTEAAKTLDATTMDRAERVYRLLDETFERASRATHVRYDLAELLWLRAETEEEPGRVAGRWEAAARGYEWALEAGGLDPERAGEAAYAAALAWRHALAAAPPAIPPAADEVRPTAPTERERRFTRALRRYLESERGAADPERPALRLELAAAYYRRDHLDRALPILDDLVARHPQAPGARAAAGMLLDGLARAGHEEALIEWVRRLRARRDLLAADPNLAETFARHEATYVRRRAAALAKAGRFLDCGQTLRALQEDQPDADEMDQVLVAAADCYERAKSIGMAVDTYRILIERFPGSPYAPRSLLRIGRAYASIARFQEAAESYERFARAHGGEEEAPEALEAAVVYRRGLGQAERAVANIDLFLRRYGATWPDRAAGALLGLAAIHEERGDRRQAAAALERYLRQLGARAGRARLVVVHAWLGRLYWELSCPGALVDGTCAAVREQVARRRGKLADRCGDVRRVILRARDSRLAARARGHFDKAVAIHERLPAGAAAGASSAAAAHAYAEARFYLIEPRFERLIATAFPGGDDPRRMVAWLADAEEQAAALARDYQALRERAVGVWRTAAVARAGQVAARLAEELLSAEVPREVLRSPHAEDGWHQYCDALAEQAAPLERTAREALGACAAQPAAGPAARWSGACRRELARLGGDVAGVAEARAPAGRVAEITSTAGLLAGLE